MIVLFSSYFRLVCFLSAGHSLGCGGRLNAPTGTITTDVDSNGKYGRNLDCVWFITAESNKVIRLTFTGSFRMEGTLGSCHLDYLEVKSSLTSSN